ncbi:hypothetical protein BC828DRAFT_372928 [Blastocladiella britannica]|nr:hypothetical protein BC828DRAFT_372928 [Blastocladiella britannica]
MNRPIHNHPELETFATLSSAEIHALQIGNEKYLRAHPEVSQLTSYFLKRVLLENPKDISSFASKLFSDAALKEKVLLSLSTPIPKE